MNGPSQVRFPSCHLPYQQSYYCSAGSGAGSGVGVGVGHVERWKRSAASYLVAGTAVQDRTGEDSPFGNARQGQKVRIFEGGARHVDS